jgi:hypothetical protein
MALKSLSGEVSLDRPAPLVLAQHGALDVARRRILESSVLAPAWVDHAGAIWALIYDDDLATLRTGDQGVFRPAAAPAGALKVRLGDRPSTPWDGSTSKVELRCDPRAQLAPGTTGWVDLGERTHAALVVPATAILQSSSGPHVMTASADRVSFPRRAVKLGRMPSGMAVVLSGLEDDQRIAVKSAFFLDAERRLGGERVDETVKR